MIDVIIQAGLAARCNPATSHERRQFSLGYPKGFSQNLRIDDYAVFAHIHHSRDNSPETLFTAATVTKCAAVT